MKRPLGVVPLSNMVTVAAFLLAGCASAPPTRPAMYFDPSSLDPAVSVIHVMPILDARTDTTAKFDKADCSDLVKESQADIEAHGYRVETVATWPADAPTSDEEIAGMSPEQLCGLAPQGCQAFLVLAINNVQSTYKVMSTSYSITGTGMLVSREKGKLIWKDVATGSYSSGGFLSAAMDSPFKKSRAKVNLTWRLFASFPPKRSM